MINLNDIDQLNLIFENVSPEEIVKGLCSRFPQGVAFSTSFGQEDQVISDIIFRHNLPVRVFTLDTGRLFPETYKTLSSTLDRYKKSIEVYYPETHTVQELVTKKGPFSFYQSPENRIECCNVRKVEPLQRALKGVSCWITGLRADQSEARKDLALFTWDEKFQVIKCSPILNWSLDDVKKYISDYNVPYNILHDRGFVSIGCEPCTRAIKPGEDIRAGRWWWEDNSKKECGLHTHK